MKTQNQHYVNKSLVKRFSNDGKTINTVHLYHRPQFINKDNEPLKVVRICEKVSEINEDAIINDSAFCSYDNSSKNKSLWSSALESILNHKVENNLITTLFEPKKRGQKNKVRVLEDCTFLQRYGIKVDEIVLNNKFKSRINAFMHILTVSSHYELFQSEESLLSYLDNIDSQERLEQFNDYKLFHIKFDKDLSTGRLILGEFPAKYRFDKNTMIDYTNPPIDCGDILVGEYEILLMCKDLGYVYNFLFANVVFNNQKVNLRYTSCVNYYKSVKKSIVFASSEKEELNKLVELFNSDEFRHYISISSEKSDIVVKRNYEVKAIGTLFKSYQKYSKA